MRRHLTVTVLAVLASGCATVGQVKALEARVNSLEKRMARVEAKTEENSGRMSNFDSRIRAVEQSCNALIEEINKIKEAKGEKPARVPK